MKPSPPRLEDRWQLARDQVRCFAQDASVLVGLARRAGKAHPILTALADPSVPVLLLLRSAAASRAVFGMSFGLSRVLATVFHVDVWSDDIGGGLRLPHPFQIVIGDGVTVGERCTLMHNVTIQRGKGTRIGEGAVLATGTVVLVGSRIGAYAMIGANSVVRGDIGAGTVAVGAPARVVRGSVSEAVAA